MSHFHNNALIGASGQGGGYNIESSLRFRSSASAYLSRTPAVAGNRQTFTYSVWIKRGDLGNGGYIAAGGADANNRLFIGFRTSTPTDCFVINNITSGVSAAYRATNSLYRDISAWYHIVVAFDTTQATAADRIKIYVNNQEITSFETSNDPAQNALMHVNNNTPNYIGQNLIDTLYFDGYMTEFNFIDGQALTPSDFGETDEDTGVWKPKKYTGTYGTNGYYLPFSDNTSTTTLVSDAKPGTFSPTFISSNNNSGASTSSLAITKPSGVAPGDLMIAFFVMGSGEMNTLSGWTELYSSSSLNRTILSRIVDGSEGASFTFTSTTTDNMSGSIVAYRNAELDVVGTMGNSDGSPDAPGITVTKNSSILLGFPSSNQESGGGYTSSGFTVRSENTDANPSHSVLDKSVDSGATGDITFTGGNTLFNRAILLSLSGTGNNFFPSGISLTADSTYDYMKDVPTLTDEDTANFATLNPLDKGTNITVTNGNLDASGSVSTNSIRATIGVSSGKWYWEADPSSTPSSGRIGISSSTSSLGENIGKDITSYAYSSQGNKVNNDSVVAYGDSYTTGDIVGVALDLDGGTITFYKNGVSQGVAFSSIPSNTYFPSIGILSTESFTINFGQRPFAYTPPTGYKTLNTFNLAEPTIVDGSQYFNSELYTGNGGYQFINPGFRPDLIWIKSRSGVVNHILGDRIRGEGVYLSPNNTNGDTSDANLLTNIGTFGFAPGSSTLANDSGESYVAWVWNADSTTVVNTNGSISSNVAVNTTAGFSIVTYTGTGSDVTVGHGLGATPKVIILKNRTSTSEWPFYTSAVDGSFDFLYLNQTTGKADSTNTPPTSTVFSLSGGSNNQGTLNNDYVAYCFVDIPGFSKIGSYTGNGSTDGPFIYTGFRPAWIMIKRVNTGGNNWTLSDTARNPYNVADLELDANNDSAEGTNTSSGSPYMDILSNGFKHRNTSNGNNANGSTYIYFAFAENPFKYSLAR